MDFYAMKRKQLQSLCKKHGVPANLRNAEMADRLTLLLKEDEQPIEPEGTNLEENERELDSDVEVNKVKKVRFSPENQTHYFVGTDNDSDPDLEYNPKNKVGTKRKSVVAKGVSKKKVLENSSQVQPLVEMIGFPGRVTRSRRQTMVEGDAQAIFSPPAPNKKKVKTAVKKVDVCDKSQPEDQLNDGQSEGGMSSRGLVQINLRSRMIVCEEKNQVPKKTKASKASAGVLLPSEIGEYNVPARTTAQPEKIQKKCKVNVAKVDDAGDRSRKIDLGGRITRSRNQSEVKNSGVETEEGIPKVWQKCAEALQLDQTFKGPGRNCLRRKSAVPVTRSMHDEELSADANEPEKTIRRSKRNLASDRVSVCGPLAETKVAGRSKNPKSVFVGKALSGKECLEVPELEEPSERTSITTSRRKYPLLQNDMKLKTVDSRKRPRNIDSGKASNFEQSVETIGQSVVLLRKSRRRTTLLSSAAIDDTEVRICEAAATVKESTQSVSGKASSVTRTQRRSSRNVRKQIVVEAKKDRFSQQATLEKESSYIVNDSLNVRSERRRSLRNGSKLNLAAPIRFPGIAAGKDKESESRTSVIAKEVVCAKIKSPLEEEPTPDIDSCSIRDGVGRPSKKKKGSSKNSVYLNIGDSAGDVDVDDHSCPSMNLADTGGDNIVDQIPIECLDKLSNMLSPTFTFPGNDQSPKSQPYCEGERSNLLYPGEAVEADETLTSKMTDQNSGVVDDQLADGSKACVLADQKSVVVELDGTWIDPPALAESLENKESEQNPVECSDKLSNVVSSTCISSGDGHSDCDVVDDQWEDGMKASFSMVQNSVQFGASGDDQPSLSENKNPDVATEKSSDTVNETSDFGRKETSQADVGSRETAETIATVGNIHRGETVPSDTLTQSKSPQQGERSSLLYSGEAVEADETLTSKMTDQNSGVVDDQLADGSKACVLADQKSGVVELDGSWIDPPALAEALENKESDETTEKSGEVVEERSALSSCDRKEKFQVDGYYLSLNRGATGHDNTIEQNPVECSDKLSNVVSSTCISSGDGHPDCDVVDDQWEDGMKASFPMVQNSVQLGASGVDQPSLSENKNPNVATEKSSDIVNETSDFGRKETVQFDVGSREPAETIATVGNIHRGETVPSDTFTQTKSPQIKQVGIPATVIAEAVSEDCERKMDSTSLKKTEFQEVEMAITEIAPVCQSLERNERHITKVQSDCEESDINAEKSSEVEEEKSAVCPHDTKEMVQVDVTWIENAVETAETCAKTIGEIHEGGVVLGDTGLTPPKSSMLKQDENQFEAQATIVRESTINHIGLLDSCSFETDIREATSSWTAELLNGHEKSEVAAKENQFCNSTDTVKIDNEDFATESTERNSKLDDVVSNKTYARVGDNKIHEALHESIDRASEGIIEKHVNEDLNGSNDCNEGEKGNREEKEKTNNDDGNDIVDVAAPFQEVKVALQSKAQACSVEGVYLDAMNSFNVDNCATSRENIEGLSDVQRDNHDLCVESEIFTDWEMSTIFGDAKEDLSEELVESFGCYLNNMHNENRMDAADNTKIVQECNQWLSGKQLGGPEQLVGEPPTSEDNERCNEQDYIDYEKDKRRNSAVAEGSACAMNSDRMGMQRRENRDSSLSFSSGFLRKAYSEPHNSNLLAEEVSIKFAGTECPGSNSSSFDDAALVCGHRNNNVASVSGISSSCADDLIVEKQNVSHTCTYPGRRGLPMHECDKFAMVERVSGVEVDEGRNGEASVDSPVTASSHEMKELKLNAASSVLNSFEIQQLFSDDKIDGLGTLNGDMSKVNSTNEKSEVKKGEEFAVVSPQFAAGKLTDHEDTSEGVAYVNQNPSQEMRIHCLGDLAITNFSARGDSKRGDVQNLDAGLISEDVKEGIEDASGIGEQDWGAGI